MVGVARILVRGVPQETANMRQSVLYGLTSDHTAAEKLCSGARGDAKSSGVG